MSEPTTFNIETAAQDFAGKGRVVKCPIGHGREEDVGRYARRQMLIHVNGWTFSAIWGFGTYCTAGRGLGVDVPPVESPDAELAAWKGEGSMIDLDGDSVEGWVSPTSLLAAVAAAERDDEEGIRAALVRTESDS